ncbi:hypothetical protein QQP08_020285 [Theobroma cacao]|nr:hypothetical protein QQP08_020285 [Theobroma cacao]
MANMSTFVMTKPGLVEQVRDSLQVLKEEETLAGLASGISEKVGEIQIDNDEIYYRLCRQAQDVAHCSSEVYTSYTLLHYRTYEI